MPVTIAPSWHERLVSEFDKPYFLNLMDFVEQEYETHTCYPPKTSIFAAFDKTPFKDVKVVILGQDPYHDQGQANGLCFSVGEGLQFPPSLQNIFKELRNDVGKEVPSNGNLECWANQGVLLLNAILTVQAHNAGSHQRHGWEQFTDAVIATLSEKREGLVFLLWGGYAKKKGAKIDAQKHLVLTSGHPSPLSANRGYWFGNQHFSKTNAYLHTRGKATIQW
ncbi:MAG: uracil-DNA glycosylase [Bacteroidetes bacterium]|nr:uracil-DNA glycosylase [Bacteroidota bacterium]